MKTFEIREEGIKFATIEARTVVSALNKAAKQYKRRACDYNGYVGPVTWGAFLPGTGLGALALKIVHVK